MIFNLRISNFGLGSLITHHSSLVVLKKWIRLALRADRRRRAMPGKHRRLIGEDEQPIVNGPQDFVPRAPPQVRAANTSLKQRVPAQNPLVLAGQMQGETARGV